MKARQFMRDRRTESVLLTQGFSLVEVTISIGIFAFVIVGIIGMLPAGMRMRAESAAETRGVLISEELFAAVRAATNLSAVEVRDGPALEERNNVSVDLRSKAVVIGYPSQTTVPFFLWADGRGVGDPDDAWMRGQLHSGTEGKAIDTLARLSATSVSANLYRVTVEVRAPASVPLANTRPAVFSSLVYSPAP